ncbi:hypothetical protein J2858_003093 [Neorhizobium galegae]|uniref:hypothetical protein n=1 Tax=Neorhizobium galegae TaxID=399 RepID=UPI001AE6F46A|nr:hypothetical protein [Neorhizobium galegae]MBP2550157.1 hypothetical protein [Neorhizobium galegae]
MQSLSNLLTALASLAWPAVAFYAFYVLQDDIKKLIGRLRKGKLLGQEIELAEEIAQLESTVETVVETVPNAAQQETNSKSSSYRERIFAEAKHSPLGAFLRASSDLELMVNQVMARTGWHEGRRKFSVREGFSRMPQDWTSRDLLKTVEQFSHLRNRIIHESRLVSEEDVRRAIDIALSLIEALSSYPIEENRVNDLVEVYADAEGKVPLQDGIRGVRLETRSEGRPLEHRIFPTTLNWYERGQLVSWEWNMGLMVPKAFYRDPSDGKLKQAWVSSCEFVGRPLQDLN